MSRTALVRPAEDPPTTLTQIMPASAVEAHGEPARAPGVPEQARYDGAVQQQVRALAGAGHGDHVGLLLQGESHVADRCLVDNGVSQFPVFAAPFGQAAKARIGLYRHVSSLSCTLESKHTPRPETGPD